MPSACLQTQEASLERVDLAVTPAICTQAEVTRALRSRAVKIGLAFDTPRWLHQSFLYRVSAPTPRSRTVLQGITMGVSGAR